MGAATHGTMLGCLSISLPHNDFGHQREPPFSPASWLACLWPSPPARLEPSPAEAWMQPSQLFVVTLGALSLSGSRSTGTVRLQAER